MKTKIILAILACVAIVSISASAINKTSDSTTAVAHESTATAGGLGSEDK